MSSADLRPNSGNEAIQHRGFLSQNGPPEKREKRKKKREREREEAQVAAEALVTSSFLSVSLPSLLLSLSPPSTHPYWPPTGSPSTSHTDRQNSLKIGKRSPRYWHDKCFVYFKWLSPGQLHTCERRPARHLPFFLFFFSRGSSGIPSLFFFPSFSLSFHLLFFFFFLRVNFFKNLWTWR